MEHKNVTQTKTVLESSFCARMTKKQLIIVLILVPPLYILDAERI
jgi:hypothetical protein